MNMDIPVTPWNYMSAVYAPTAEVPEVPLVQCGQPEGTPIMTPYGTFPNHRIWVGVPVLDPYGGVGEVLEVHKYPKMQIYQVTAEDGAVTYCSSTHKLFVSPYDDGNYKKIYTERAAKLSQVWYTPSPNNEWSIVVRKIVSIVRTHLDDCIAISVSTRRGLYVTNNFVVSGV